MKVQHQGCLHPARFIKYCWYDDPVVWGTMGDGYPVFQQPAHVALNFAPMKPNLTLMPMYLSYSANTRECSGSTRPSLTRRTGDFEPKYFGIGR